MGEFFSEEKDAHPFPMVVILPAMNSARFFMRSFLFFLLFCSVQDLSAGDERQSRKLARESIRKNMVLFDRTMEPGHWIRL